MAPKSLTGSKKWSTPRLMGTPINFCKISFLFEHSFYEKSRQQRRNRGEDDRGKEENNDRKSTGCLKKTALIENRFKDIKYEAKFHQKSTFSSKWPSLWHENYIPIASWVFLGCFMGVFRLFHGCFKDTPRLFQEYFNVILEYIMGVTRVFLGGFCPI